MNHKTSLIFRPLLALGVLTFALPSLLAQTAARTVYVKAGHLFDSTSDTLRDGVHLAGTLSGANFLLVTPVQTAGLSGDIEFLGTVVNNRIAGSIQGTVTGTAGTGTCSGNFSAAK